MNGTIYVEWAFNENPKRPDYFGYGEIDGKRVSVTGEIEVTKVGVKRVKLVVREREETRA